MIMKTIKFLFFSFFTLLIISCQDENISSDTKLNSNDISNIEKKYNVKISKRKVSDDKLSFSTKNELIKHLDLMKDVNTKPLYSSLKGNFSKEEIDNNNKILDSLLLLKKKITSTNILNKNDPPNQYSYTFYFDNNFPCSNVYVNITYSTNSNGQVISSSVSTGTWGYSYGNTYSQTNTTLVSIFTNNNGSYIVFQATGQFSTSMGLGSFSATNSNTADYTGHLFIPLGNNGGSSGGFCKQTPNDHTTEANN